MATCSGRALTLAPRPSSTPRQIWALPNTPRLKPAYSTRHFPAEAKRAGLVPVVAPINSAGVSSAREADGPAPVNADLHLLATILAPGQVVYHTFKQPLSGGKKRKAFVHVVHPPFPPPPRLACCKALVRATTDTRLHPSPALADPDFGLQHVGLVRG